MTRASKIFKNKKRFYPVLTIFLVALGGFILSVPVLTGTDSDKSNVTNSATNNATDIVAGTSIEIGHADNTAGTRKNEIQHNSSPSTQNKNHSVQTDTSVIDLGNASAADLLVSVYRNNQQQLNLRLPFDDNKSYVVRLKVKDPFDNNSRVFVDDADITEQVNSQHYYVGKADDLKNSIVSLSVTAEGTLKGLATVDSGNYVVGFDGSAFYKAKHKRTFDKDLIEKLETDVVVPPPPPGSKTSAPVSVEPGHVESKRGVSEKSAPGSVSMLGMSGDGQDATTESVDQTSSSAGPGEPAIAAMEPIAGATEIINKSVITLTETSGNSSLYYIDVPAGQAVLTILTHRGGYAYYPVAIDKDPLNGADYCGYPIETMGSNNDYHPTNYWNRCIIENPPAGRYYIRASSIGFFSGDNNTDIAMSVGYGDALQADERVKLRISIEVTNSFRNQFADDSETTGYIGQLFNYVSPLWDTELKAKPVVGDIFLHTYEVTYNQSLNDLKSHHETEHPNATKSASVFLMFSTSIGYAGFAFLDGMCHSEYSYALAGMHGYLPTEGNNGWDPMVFSHELGHNMNSEHTHEYDGVLGVSEPVDICYNDSQYPADPTDSLPRDLPGENSLTGGAYGAGHGTIMSYCHIFPDPVSGFSTDNSSSFTYGENHIYGKSPNRVPQLMRNRLMHKSAASTCMPIVSVNPTAPDAPSISGISSASDSLTVNITPPLNDGSDPITAYSVDCNGNTASNGSSPVVVSGLASSTAYSCTATVSNSIGTSDPSTSVSATTLAPPTVPDAPGISSIDKTDTTLTVYFNAGADGGSAVTSFTTNCDGFEAIGAASPIEITGLTPSTTYSCTVAANNSIGRSNPSASVSATTLAPPTVPDAPSISTIDLTHNSLSVNFTAGADGGAAITGFTASCDGASVTGTSSPLLVTGLTPSTAYNCTVNAINNVGTSNPSSSVSATTLAPPTLPDAPTITSIDASSTALSVNFSAGSDGGSAITSFTATCGSQQVNGGSSPISVGGLTAETTYSCTVSATNAVGSSALSIAVQATTLVDVATGIEQAIATGNPAYIPESALALEDYILNYLQTGDLASPLQQLIFGADAISFSPTQYSIFVTPDPARDTEAMVIGNQGNTFMTALEENGNRYLAAGQDLLYESYLGNHPGFDTHLTRLVSWMLAPHAVDFAGGAELKIVSMLADSYYISNGWELWMQSKYPNVTTLRCGGNNAYEEIDAATLKACTAGAHLILIGTKEYAPSDSVLAVLDQAVATGQSLFYNHNDYWASNALTNSILNYFGAQTEEPGQVGNFFVEDSASWSSASNMLYNSGGFADVESLVTKFRDNSFSFLVSSCDTGDTACKNVTAYKTEYLDAVEKVKATIENYDAQGVDIFGLAGKFTLDKLMILLGDKYRQSVTFPMSKDTTPTNDFLKALYADHTVYNSRDFAATPVNLGNFSRSDFSHITPTSKSVQLISRMPYRSAGVYVLPGQTITVQRTDTNSDVGVYIMINTQHKDSTRLMDIEGGYKRPRFLKSNRVYIEAGQTVKLTSPYGGPIQVGFADQGSQVNLSFYNIGLHPHWRTGGDDADFQAKLTAAEYDWAEVATEHFEIHSTLAKMNETMSADVRWDQASELEYYITKYHHNYHKVMGGFQGDGIDVVPEIHSFAQNNGLTVPEYNEVLHFNADQPRCGIGCSGNPYDANWAFEVLGHGDLHEVGHNIESSRFKPNSFDYHTTTNYYVYYAKSRGIAEDGFANVCSDLSFDSLYSDLSVSSGNVSDYGWRNGVTLMVELVAQAQASGTLSNGWHLVPRLHILEAAFKLADDNDTAWAAAKDNLGFGNFTRTAAKALNNTDWLLIAASHASGLNYRPFFDMFNLSYSASADSQVAAFGYPPVERAFYYPNTANGYCVSLTGHDKWLVSDTYNLQLDNSLDSVAPVVTAPSAITAAAQDANGTAATDSAIATFLGGATASDSVDGSIATITHNAPSIFSIGVTTVIFSATDSAGNTGTASATVTVADQDKPVITLIGETSLTVSQGTTYTDAGATASDNVDGDISTSIQVSGSVDTSNVGSYTLTYSVADAAGNAALAVSRNVTVSNDIDADGLPDEFEDANGLDKNNPADASSDLDGDGISNLDEYLNGSDAANDDVAPIFTAPDDLTIPATGLETAVDLSDIEMLDDRDGLLLARADKTGPFTAGSHTITWTVTDVSGNSTSDTQIVSIIPLVTMGADANIGENQNVSITFTLSAAPISYPVTINYVIDSTSTADTDDHDLAAGSVTINDGLSGSISFNTINDGTSEGTETLVLMLDTASNAAIGVDDQLVLTLIEDNRQPLVSFTVIQNNVATLNADTTQGLVVVQSLISDPNPGDQHSYDWSLSDNTLSDLDGDGTTFSFDPSALNDGVYTLTLIATDQGGLSTQMSQAVRVVTHTSVLSSSLDRDGDGINDADEGRGDSDGDGIDEFLDNNQQPANILPIDNGRYIQADNGLLLKLGNVAFAANQPSVTITETDLSTFAEPAPNVEVADPSFDHLSAIFDFVVSGLPEPGASASLVIDLAQALPANAIYRKFLQNEGWVTFEAIAGNSIASTSSQGGVCPAGTDSAWMDGLNQGADCVRLTLVDGGIYDADGLTNGAIADPGAIAVAKSTTTNQNSSSTTDTGAAGGGGVFTIELLSLLMLFMLMKDNITRVPRRLTVK